MILLSCALFAISGVDAYAITIPVSADNAQYVEDVLKQTNVKIKKGSDTSTVNTTITVRSKDRTKESAGGETLMSYSGGVLTFDENAFTRANEKDAKKALGAFVDELKVSNVTYDMQQDIMSQIQESHKDVAAIMIPLIFDNATGDIFTAYRWLSPFLDVVQLVFGIAAIVIIFWVVFTTAIDLFFMSFPVWRGKLKDDAKPWGVSYDAIKTVNEIEKQLGEGDYQNVYFMYFKRRTWTYIILSICVLFLIVGGLGDVIAWVLGLGSGVVG